MNYNSFVKKLSLGEKDFEEIKDAVSNAEKRTSGEIALAVIPESSSYAFWELLTAVVTALLLAIALFPIADGIYSWLCGIFWGERPWYLAAFFMTVCALAVILLYLAYNIPAIDSIVVPQAARHHAVYARAMRYFTESGVYDTSNHSGVLIFVSYFEREVRIIADRGISEKISQDLWNLIADEISESFSKKNVKEAFVNAVNRCADLLAEYFPLEGEKKNELVDGLVLLRNDRWA